MFNYSRRKTEQISVGKLFIGSDFPIRVQTMANTDTNNIEASVAQAKRCLTAGTEILRYTTQGIKEVENLKIIKEELLREGIELPLVADIHFNSNVAEHAAKYIDKIRINPGNFVTSKHGDYNDIEWEEEKERIRLKLKPILLHCKENKRAIRIGVNHGSLSPRILNRYGNTPEGLVASCLEFIEMCEKEHFYNLILSVKASNSISMIHSVRLLVCEMDKRGMRYPLHLGVTEAGSDDEGRIKSAIGIGTLLGEGIGDTVRVSLSELPEAEVPVAKKLVDYIEERIGHTKIEGTEAPYFSRYKYQRRKSENIANIGSKHQPVVVSTTQINSTPLPDYTIDTLPQYKLLLSEDIDDLKIEEIKSDKDKILLLKSNHKNPVGSISAAIHRLTQLGINNPIIVERDYQEDDLENLQIKSASDFGPLLIDGLIDGIYLTNTSNVLNNNEVNSIAFEILQSSRARISKTEYISCPSCGRTKFDLPKVVQQVKAATSGYVGLKIAVMGCIVNGPGEMADADFGYIGAGQGRVSLYKGKECVEKNIPENEAIEHLLKLINQTYIK